MQHETEVFLPIVVLLIIFTAGTIIPISITLIQNRTKMKAIEMLKAYAEKGQEPPPGMLDAVNRLNWPVPPGPPPTPWGKQSRGEHLSHVAGGIPLILGGAAVIWWRAPYQQGDHVGPLMVAAVIATIFFTGSTAARLVAAIYASD
jgi:hypothetical protein